MKSSFIVVLLLTLFIAPMVEAKGDRVVARKKRITLLEDARAALDVADPATVAAIKDARYPFEFKPVPKPVVAPSKPDAPTPVEPEPEPLTDAEILEEIATRIKPTGVMFRQEGQGVLILPGAKQLPDGSAIRVNLEKGGGSVMIKVINVTSDSYDLQLNNETLTRRFDETAGRGVTIDQ